MTSATYFLIYSVHLEGTRKYTISKTTNHISHSPTTTSRPSRLLAQVPSLQHFLDLFENCSPLTGFAALPLPIQPPASTSLLIHGAPLQTLSSSMAHRYKHSLRPWRTITDSLLIRGTPLQTLSSSVAHRYKHSPHPWCTINTLANRLDFLALPPLSHTLDTLILGKPIHLLSVS